MNAMFSRCCLIALLVVPGRAHAAELTAQEAKAFFNARGCNSCHAVNETRLGPAFMDVSQRYAGAPAATDEVLTQKILHGGAGSWGFVPMISNPKVPEADARAIADWILKLRVRDQTH